MKSRSGDTYLGSLYLVHILIMKCRCQLGMCHLSLTSFSRSTDLNLRQVSDEVSFAITIQPGLTILSPKFDINLIKSVDHENEVKVR
jgi:hypothetical protein